MQNKSSKNRHTLLENKDDWEEAQRNALTSSVREDEVVEEIRYKVDTTAKSVLSELIEHCACYNKL